MSTPRFPCRRPQAAALARRLTGAHLANAAAAGECEVFYWRERNREVDFIVKAGRRLVAIEVKSGRTREMPAGMAASLPGRRSRGLGRGR